MPVKMRLLYWLGTIIALGLTVLLETHAKNSYATFFQTQWGAFACLIVALLCFKKVMAADKYLTWWINFKIGICSIVLLILTYYSLI